MKPLYISAGSAGISAAVITAFTLSSRPHLDVFKGAFFTLSGPIMSLSRSECEQRV